MVKTSWKGIGLDDKEWCLVKISKAARENF